MTPTGRRNTLQKFLSGDAIKYIDELRTRFPVPVLKMEDGLISILRDIRFYQQQANADDARPHLRRYFRFLEYYFVLALLIAFGLTVTIIIDLWDEGTKMISGYACLTLVGMIILAIARFTKDKKDDVVSLFTILILIRVGQILLCGYAAWLSAHLGSEVDFSAKTMKIYTRALYALVCFSLGIQSGALFVLVDVLIAWMLNALLGKHADDATKVFIDAMFLWIFRLKGNTVAVIAVCSTYISRIFGDIFRFHGQFAQTRGISYIEFVRHNLHKFNLLDGDLESTISNQQAPQLMYQPPSPPPSGSESYVQYLIRREAMGDVIDLYKRLTSKTSSCFRDEQAREAATRFLQKTQNGGLGSLSHPQPKTYLAVHVPETLINEFSKRAQQNTDEGLETCGILCGSRALDMNLYRVTVLIIPKQTVTSNSCTAEHVEEYSDYLEKQNLIVLGWIHTHPSQDCFMSSVDLHTQYAYQLLLPETIAIVVAPNSKTSTVGTFRISAPGGLSVIKKCIDQKLGLSQFHEHEDPEDGSPLYELCNNVHLVPNSAFNTVDLR